MQNFKMTAKNGGKKSFGKNGRVCGPCGPKISIFSISEIKQAISAREWALCQLTVCFEFQSRSDRRKGHKSYALEMVFRRKVRR